MKSNLCCGFSEWFLEFDDSLYILHASTEGCVCVDMNRKEDRGGSKEKHVFVLDIVNEICWCGDCESSISSKKQ